MSFDPRVYMIVAFIVGFAVGHTITDFFYSKSETTKSKIKGGKKKTIA